MRVYLSPAVQQLISAATLCLALGALGAVLWTAFDMWTSDPTLEQIQNLQKTQ